MVFRTVALAAWLVAALSILGVLDRTTAALDNFSTNFGDLRISALLFIKAIVFLSIALWIATGVGNYFEGKIRGATDLSASLQVLIGKLVKLSLYTLTIVIVLNSVGFDFRSSLFVFSGAIGVGLGFGMQKIVSNFVSGIILLADKSIKPGDVISVGESFGWVDTMGARSTVPSCPDTLVMLVWGRWRYDVIAVFALADPALLQVSASGISSATLKLRAHHQVEDRPAYIVMLTSGALSLRRHAARRQGRRCAVLLRRGRNADLERGVETGAKVDLQLTIGVRRWRRLPEMLFSSNT